MSQNAKPWAQYGSGRMHHWPVERREAHRRPISRTPAPLLSASPASSIATIVARTSLSIASDTNVGCALTQSSTREATPSAISASARARSVTSSKPALSTMRLTTFPASPFWQRSLSTTVALSSASRHASPARRASEKASAARSPLSPASLDEAAGQIERSKRLPQSAAKRKRRSCAVQASSESSPAAAARQQRFRRGASVATGAAHAARPAAFCAANGSTPNPGEPISK
mmetsp:Transcript_9754/g.31982  ORF Transcript_9754/g.31982 Transcript_9754/m.31982 type:complete len:230 (+) Transcript_9754:2150-2839(+)